MEAPPLERKLVAILAADVAGYSRLMESDEEGTLATLSTFRLVTDDLISRHGGRICGTAGDSILAAFASALAAVHCAVDIQNDLAKANDALDKDRRMHFSNRNQRRRRNGEGGGYFWRWGQYCGSHRRARHSRAAYASHAASMIML